MTTAQKNKVHEALNMALNSARGLLPKKTGLLQSQFNYRIVGNDCIIYINDKCWYAKYLLEKDLQISSEINQYLLTSNQFSYEIKRKCSLFTKL